MKTVFGYPRAPAKSEHELSGRHSHGFCANEVAWQIAKKFKNARALLHHQGCAQLKRM